MSLLAWYPLIKDGKNQGLDGTNLTLRGTVSFTAGKLGNAATFSQNAANSYHKAGGYKLADKFSWACWVKVTTTESTAQQFILSEGRDVGSIGMSLRCNKDGTLWVSSTAGSITIGKPALDTWHHVAITVNSDDKIRTYLDGIESGTAIAFKELDYAQSDNAFVIGKMSYGYGAATTYFPFCGQVQDVRIYDHVLSKKEIKELSKGLCLYLPLDWGGKPNLLNKSNNQFYFDYNNTSANTVLFWQSGILALESGVSYTISFDAKIDTSDNTMRQCLECDLYPDSLPQRNWYHNTDEAVSNQWKHFTWTTSSTVSAITSCSLRFFCDNTDSNVNLKVKAPIHVKNIKLEKGTVDTPYVPPITNPDYTKYGFDKAYYQDCSGYNIVMTKTGTPIVDSTSPRGITSTNFNQAGYLYTSSFNRVFTAFTIACWLKIPSTISSQHFLLGTFNNWTNNGIGVWRDTNGGLAYSFLIRDTSASGHGSVKTPAFTANTWQHWAATWDGASIKHYLNGELKSTTAYGSSGSVSMPVFYLGNSLYNNTPTSEIDECSVSDFRVYATVLSADDIKALYQNSVEIDKTGKMYCRTLVEV